MPVPGISCHIGGAIATGVCTVFVRSLYMVCGTHGLWHTWAVAHMGCGKRHQYLGCEGAVSLYTNL